jgi:hypothetical protein
VTIQSTFDEEMTRSPLRCVAVVWTAKREGVSPWRVEQVVGMLDGAASDDLPARLSPGPRAANSSKASAGSRWRVL